MRLAGILILIGAGFIFFWEPQHYPHFDDFEVFYEAGTQYLHGTSAYLTQPGWPAGLKFKYSPFVALLFSGTFSQLPLEWAQWLFFGLMALGWAWWARSLAGTELLPRGIKQPRLLALAVLLSFFCVALRDELKMGQINLVALACLLAVYLELDRKSPRIWLAALALALGVQFKLYILICVPLLLMRRQFPLVLLSGVFTLSLAWLPLALTQGAAMSSSELVTWIRALAESTAGLVFWPENTSGLATLTKWTGSVGLGRATWGAAVACFLWLQWRARGARWIFQYALQLSWIMVLNPLAWPYWLLFSLPAALVMVGRVARRHFPSQLWPRFGWALAISIVYLLTNLLNGPAAYVGTPTVVALVIAFATYWIVKRPYPRST